MKIRDHQPSKNAAMVEESTAASHSLALETGVLADLIGQFKAGASIAHRPAAQPAPIEKTEPHAAQDKPAKAVRTFRANGNAAVKADDREEL